LSDKPANRAAAANGGSSETPKLVQAAEHLEADLSSFESLTARVTRMELTTHEEIRKAADILQKAADAHGSFVVHLRELIEAIDDLRSRQNASATRLSDCAGELDQRRLSYEALEQRFADLGTQAKEINELIRKATELGRDTPENRDTTLVNLRAARERLDLTVGSAAQLVADAREAKLVDLANQADALRQQLQSLAKKLERVELAIVH
jgi:chromosome segregation ATPase